MTGVNLLEKSYFWAEKHEKKQKNQARTDPEPANIDGGHFAVKPFSGDYGYNFLLNCIDSAYKNGSAKIRVKGGTFENFNPADCKAEGEHTSFVPDGYTVESKTVGSDIWYTVVPKTNAN